MGINEVMVPVNAPISTIAYILDLLAGYKVYTVVDIKKAFYQLALSLRSRKYTAFSTQSGHWQYCVCPQGIKIGPGLWTIVIGRCLRKHRKYCTNYFDDIIIYSNNIDEHLEQIILVFETLKEFGFKISGTKMTLVSNEISVLGYIVSGTHVKINPDKISTIKNRPEPKKC